MREDVHVAVVNEETITKPFTIHIERRNRFFMAFKRMCAIPIIHTSFYIFNKI